MGLRVGGRVCRGRVWIVDWWYGGRGSVGEVIFEVDVGCRGR